MLIGPFVTDHDIVIVAPDATLRDAADRMRARGVGSALVTAELRGGAFGIITERDLLRATADCVDPQDMRVAAYRTSDAVTITPEWHVVDAAKAMMQRGFRHLIVVDGGKLVGVVSMRDMVRALLQDRQRMAAG